MRDTGVVTDEQTAVRDSLHQLEERQILRNREAERQSDLQFTEMRPLLLRAAATGMQKNLRAIGIPKVG